MTAAEKINMRNLYELIKEKCGTLKRFCNLYGYHYPGTKRVLSGASLNFDQALYDLMRDQALGHQTTVNSEVVLLDMMIRIHFGSIEACAAALRYRKATVLRILNDADVTSAEFIKLAFGVYSAYLHVKQGVAEYVNTMAPGKYLNKQARRAQNLKKLQR